MPRNRLLVLPALILAGAALLPAVAAGTGGIVRPDLDAKDRARVAAVTRPTTDFSKPEAFELMQGGAGTSQKLVSRDAFSQFSANGSFEALSRFQIGNGFFTKTWVSSPSSTEASDGLGPLFNARSCQGCHTKDGRGRPPFEGEKAVSMFLRLSVPARTDEERQALANKSLLRIPEKTYGGQLQNFAVQGVDPEGEMRIAYEEVPVTLKDGTLVSLRRPTYSVANLHYGPMDPEVRLSPRVAPQMIGLGLVEQIPEADILAHADPDDRDGDGVRGLPSRVRDPETGQLTLGRFGWKASTPSLKSQAADAFSGDMGLSTPVNTSAFGECTESEAACLGAPTGVQERLGPVEVPDPILDLVAFYSRNLAVPARRDIGGAEVLKGKAAFYGAGCPACHVPKFVTRRDAPDKAQAFQLVWPYSDFLLHDMGDGLADGAPVGDASGSQWRTAPLWGIGLTKTVTGHAFFLHDGRARTLAEAILWHGGEAAHARDAFAAMDEADRDAMIAFLESL